MPLKKLPRRLVRKSEPTRTSDILTIEISGTDVRDYNEAAAEKKAAEETMKELAVLLKEEALVEILPRNCADPASPISSVVLVDDRGESIRVSFTSKYNNTDPALVEKTFDMLEEANAKLDVNDYVVETLAAKFNSKVFLADDGSFSRVRYERFFTAIQAVADSLKVENPLSTEKVVIPKPDFHERRWKDFTAAQQVPLTLALPNTVTLTPIADKKTK